MKKSHLFASASCLLLLALLVTLFVLMKINRPGPVIATPSGESSRPSAAAVMPHGDGERKQAEAIDSHPVIFTAEIPAQSAPITKALPPYIKRSRPTQLNIAALPARTTAPGRQDRLEIFPDVTPTVKWEQLSDNGSGNWAWFGSLLEDRMSMVTLTRVGDYTILDIQSPKFGHYEIHGQDDKTAEVRQIDADQVSQGCKTSMITAEFGDAAAMEFVVAEPASQANAIAAFTAMTVDVLMVYTIRARDLAGGRSAIAARAQSAINGLNNNFLRPSGTDNDIVHTMRLMGARETSRIASNSLPTELSWVAGNSGIATMRSDTGADFVAMISDKDDAGVRGIAQLPGAFSANFYDTLSGVWPHEAGHNFGCQHNSPGVFSYASGHYWTDASNGVQYGSLMSYIGSRVPYFSDPNVSYSGHPTGTPDRNNALCVNNRGDDAAAYQSSKTLIEPSCVVTASTLKPAPGTDFTVTITSTNGGPATASAAQINLALPSLLTLISHNGGAAFNTSTKVWSIPSLADNASASLMLTFRPTASANGVSQTVSAALGSLGNNVVDYDIYNNSGSVSVVSVPPASSSLVLHYPLDENSGKTAVDTCANDAAQNATTTYATPQWQPAGGMIGGSLYLTPTAQADVAQAFSYNSTVPIITNYPFTMALWLKTGTSAWYEVCAMLGDQTLGSSYFELSVNSSKANAMARNTTNTGVSATSTTLVSDNQWHHVAGVFTSATSRTLYLNGVAITTNTTSVPFVTNNKRFALGALMRDVPTQSFPGSLDDIGLWNTALPKEHIALIHALGRYSHVDLDHPAITTLLPGGTSAQAGELFWVPTTGLTGSVGNSGIQNGQPYVVLNANGSGLTTAAAHEAAGFWFDQNGATAGFGVADVGNYDWLGTNFWNANNAGVGTLAAWANAGDDAFLIGAGQETRYTVRLGPTGSGNVTLRNLFLNSDGSLPALPLGSGNAAIGNPGDTGELRLSSSDFIGTAGGILTIHNPVNLGANRSMTFSGGSVGITGLVSGTGTSGVSLSPGVILSPELRQGMLTLANIGNSYTGPTTIDANYALEVAKLANGGLTSSIGASSISATNLVLNGGTLRYTGAAASCDRNFILSSGTSSVIDVSTPAASLTLSGATTATTGAVTKVGEGALILGGANLHTGSTTLRAGTLSVGATTHFGNGNGIVFDGGSLQVTGTSLTTFTGHAVSVSADTSVSFDITNSLNNFTVSPPLALGTGGLTKLGAGTLTLGGANNYTGATAVNGGVLVVNVAGALGASSSVTVSNSGRVTFKQATTQGPASPISYAMPFAITGNGGSVTGGALLFNAPSNRSNYSISAPLTLGGSGLSLIVSYNAGTNYVNLAGGITGTGGLEIQAGGANAAHAHLFTLAGTLDYAGSTRFETGAASGRIVLNNTTLPSLTVLSLGAQTNVGTNVIQFDLNGNSQTLAGLQTFLFNGVAAGTNQIINTSPTPATLTLNNTGNHTFGGNLGANGQAPIAGTAGTGNNFGLVKAGSGTLSLSGINTYTGDTMVTAGILAVAGSSIADANKLVIDGGNVQATATEVVNTLFFGTTQQAAGTWGASSSGAAHIDDVRFSGSGMVSVLTGPFASWIAGFEIAVANQDPTDDPDGDGLNNLLEYVVGGNPGANDVPSVAPVGTSVGSGYLFTFRRSNLSEADTTLTVEYGSNLNVMGSVPIGAAPGVAPVVIQEDTPNASFDTVTVTLPTGGSPSFFARIKVEK